MCIFVIWLTVGSCSHVMNLEMCCVVDLSEGSHEFLDNTGMYHTVSCQSCSLCLDCSVWTREPYNKFNPFAGCMMYEKPPKPGFSFVCFSFCIC